MSRIDKADFTPVIGGYSGVGPFRFWCQKVLPLVYDDTLSYYELLCKVVDYLNKTISDVGMLENNVEEIVEAYDKLQDYVNNYFSSLDVQEEIDKKLDEMVEDGTFIEIVEPYFNQYKEEINVIIEAQNDRIDEAIADQNETINNGFEEQNDRIDNAIAQQNENINSGFNVQNNKLNALESRMDTFTNLESGSTTGDAELADGRISFTGYSYPNIGDAIRAQAEFNNTLILNNSGQELFATWQTGVYYNLSVNATQVTVGAPDIVDENFKCGYLPCREGDVFYVTSRGASAARNWAFISAASTNNILSRTLESYQLNNAKIVAPAGAAFVVFNASVLYQANIIVGEYVNNKIKQIDMDTEDAYRNAVISSRIIDTFNIDHNKYYTTTNGGKYDFNGYCCSSELLPVNPMLIEGAVFRTIGGSNGLFVLFYDQNKNYIKSVRAPLGNTYSAIGCAPPNTFYIGISSTIDINYLAIEVVKGADVIEYPFNDDGYMYFENRFCSNEGVILAANTTNMIVVPNVKEGDKWYTNTTGQVIFGFFNSDMVYLGEGTRETSEYHGTLFTAPANTAYACINTTKTRLHGGVNSSVFYKITKEEKILCLGDSITYLDGRSGFDGATLFLGYQKILQKAGYLTESYGYSGYTYAEGVVYEGSPIGSIYNEIVTNQLDVSGYDYVILSGGSNDDLYGVSVGSVPNSYSGVVYDTETMCGALGAIVEYIRTNNSKCKIILCTILKSEASRRPFNESKTYAQIVRDFANYASCYLCDNYENYNVQPFTNGWSEFFYDSSHPNKAGMVRLGKLMLNAVEQA